MDGCLDGSGVEISIYRSPYGVILLMLAMLGLLALSARYLLDLLPFLLRKVREKAEAGRQAGRESGRAGWLTALGWYWWWWCGEQPQVQNRWLWMVASGVLYTCSISGLVFDIIRNPPPFYMDPVGGHRAQLARNSYPPFNCPL